MDIHPPHAIHSWKDFLVQLATITAGILIALSLEGLREAWHDHALVREARENIRREIADNKREVDGELARLPEARERLESALQYANDRLASKKTNVHTINVGFSLAELSSASWVTADRTGALSHMDYDEAQRYSRVYGQQDLYAQQQRQAVGHVSGASSVWVNSSDPDLLPLKDVEVFRGHVVALFADLFITEQLGRGLSKSYKKVLEQQ